jgi:hypothetical protein
VDDRRRRLLREARGLIEQRAPGVRSVDRGPHHGLGDAGDPRDGWRDLRSVRQRDQARIRVRDRVADSRPADFQEMAAWRRGRGLTVDRQDLEV